ncbi:hypothetical protein [Pseudonocardia sp. H11422]|uniref:copper amine oxidase n=1 Tax=Pseudonocardia sp. H11422 TaxID=2835866 RepID=UPI0027E3651C
MTQPEGPSFTVSGREVSWQKWRLRVGFSPSSIEVCRTGEVRRARERLAMGSSAH